MSGLCAGVAYSAEVSTSNGAGSSGFSAASAAVVPLVAQVPSEPLLVSVFGRDGALAVSWSAPADDGGDPVSGYVLSATPTGGGSAVSVSPAASATSATISGLTDGTEYVVSLSATNSVGNSLASTMDGTPSVAYAPGGPTEVTATPDGSGDVQVSWSPPADDGGDAISGYTVTWQEDTSGSTPQSTTVDGSTTSVSLPASDFSPQNA
ncbi:MAG: fibronectin type III domain-containing protein, partial [Solirubrobacteraceae bacterium]